MKQHITEKQFNELSEKNKQQWKDWMVKKGYYSGSYQEEDYVIDGFPNIGWMIEYLDVYKQLTIAQREIEGTICTQVSIFTNRIYKQLCDTLWQATKEKLEK